MTQPTPYTRQANFTDYQASNPTSPLDGASVDAEFNAAKVTLDGVLTSLALLQRDDGALKNGLVTLDSLTSEVLIALGAGATWAPRGEWATSTAYIVSDVVSEGTATYVCATDHTAAASFATDLAAGYWVRIFDSAGTTPSDGSVTTAKIADGAVTAAKIGFSSLDLTGSIRAATGLQAGTAALGGLLHAKAAAGDALAKIERTTDAQGKVGVQIIGTSVTWELSQPDAGDSLDLRRGSTQVATFTDEAGVDVAGAVRATTGVVPAAGQGIGLHFAGGVGFVTSYDYGAGAWRALKARGSTVTLTASGVDVLEATSTGVNVAGTMKRNNVELGWLDLPQNAQNAAYTLALADRGKHVYSKNVAGQTIVVPTNAASSITPGMVFTIINHGTNPITIAPSTGVTFLLAGTGAQGNRTLATKGIATLICTETDVWFISGVGIS
jgi:hypothetical protein